MATHVPVMLAEVLDAALGHSRLVDGTVGHGGHAAALLESTGGTLLAIDRDPTALTRARDLIGNERVTWRQGNFADPAVLDEISRFEPDFILLDLGVSSSQFDEDGRGFSFRPGASLDMRMAPGPVTAADLLNSAPQRELEVVLRDYGDERRYRRLAAEIVRRRGQRPFAVSDDLVNAIRAVHGPRSGPAVFARIFQALRIAVNDELASLERALPALRSSLTPGGTLAVISYHSGEDRLVKVAFREWSRDCVCPPEALRCSCRGKPLGSARPRKPITASDAEILANPRARSAKLRLFHLAE